LEAAKNDRRFWVEVAEMAWQDLATLFPTNLVICFKTNEKKLTKPHCLPYLSCYIKKIVN
jgi:hypothetical protein